MVRSIPVIAMDANAMKKDQYKAFEVGYDGYITKPIDGRDFLRKVATYLSDRRKVAEEQR
jgi:CheY-like chemotaxis protein